MIDPVEELLQVQIYDNRAAFGYVTAGLGQGVMRPVSHAKAEARVREGWVQDRVQHLQDRLLHKPVNHRRDAQLSHPAARLGDFDSPHRLRLVAAVQQRSDEFLFVLGEPVAQFVEGHPIYARRSLVGFDTTIRSIQVLAVCHLLHQMFGQGSCLVARRGCLWLLGHGGLGSALAACAVAQALPRLLKEQSLVKPAWLPLHTHRVRPDCSLQ